MKETQKLGLLPLPPEMMAQERLNNAASARWEKDRGKKLPEAKKPEPYLLTRATEEVNLWWDALEAHYVWLAKNAYEDRREYLCEQLEADRSGTAPGIYCRLPVLSGRMASWSGKELNKGEFTEFLRECSQLSEGSINGSVKDSRLRIKQTSVDALFSGLELPEEKRESFYAQFGRYPLTEENWLPLREQALRLLERKYPGATDAQKMARLGLSSSSLNNARNHRIRSNAMAFHFLIMLGTPMPSPRNRKLYRAFGLAPIPQGAADQAAAICLKHREDLLRVLQEETQKLEGAPEEAFTKFWSIFRGLINHYDKKSSCKLYGQFFSQENSELFDVIPVKQGQSVQEGVRL